MKTTLAALAAIIAGLSLSIGMSRAEAATFELYTGSGLPAEQEWLTFTNRIGASQNIVSGGVNLNTNPTNSSASNFIYAGYSNYLSSGQLKKDSFPHSIASLDTLSTSISRLTLKTMMALMVPIVQASVLLPLAKTCKASN
jgi:hypothetical protein